MSCEIIKKLCPTGLKNNPNKSLKKVSYITIHCTGNRAATATAKNHADYQYGGSGGGQISWHYTVDKDSVYQSFEDNQACWHAGDGTGDGNMSSIGIEICVNDREGFAEACIRAAELTAELLKRHGLSIDRVVQHNKWSGKNCPQELRSGEWGVSWDEFVDSVKDCMENGVEEMSGKDMEEPSEWARPAWAWAVKNRIVLGGEPQAMATREQVAQMLYAASRCFNEV